MRYPLLALSALLLSCGGDDGGITAPDTGSLEIRASTTGETAADFMVSIDGGSGRTLAPNGTLTVSDLELGFHTVGIVAPPPGCTVVGDNPRTVTVAAGSTNVVTFEVNCAPLLGSIQVTMVTTGTGPASYDLVMDGTSIGPIGSSSTRTIENVPPGSHTIALGNVPPGCQVQGASTQTVTVEPSASAAVTFSITCTGPSGGTLNVTVSTSGPEADPDGYQVVVDGGTPQPIGVNATVTLTSVAAGNHSVRLDGVAANCSVSGPNPQTVSVPSNGTATVTFAVTCAASQPATGTLRITTVTSGSDADPDGYLITINDQEPVEIGADDELALDLEPGSYTVTLSGVAENCTVSEAEQTAEVTAGETEEVQFEVTCRTVGTLHVITETMGQDLDENGYVLVLDGQQFGQIDSNGERTVRELAPGEYQVELGDVAENCEVAGENPRPVTVTVGETAETKFDVTCSALGSIEVTTTTTGEPADPDGYTFTIDGAEPQEIGLNATVLVRDLAEGSYAVELDGLAANCTVPAEANPQTAVVAAGETTEVSFDVTCSGTSNARR